MEPTTTIIFFNIKREEIGSVDFDGTTLAPSEGYAKNMVEFYAARGMSPEAWVKKFSSWSNGYAFSKISD